MRNISGNSIHKAITSKELAECASRNNDIVLQDKLNNFFGKYFDDDLVTEICVNRPHEIFYEKNNAWFKDEHEELDYDNCRVISSLLASYRQVTLSEVKPILSGTLPNGQRVQIVIPPACAPNCISITIRKPSKTRYTMQDYKESGLFENTRGAGDFSKNDPLVLLYNEKQWEEFCKQAVLSGKNIVIAGETGSGKTTFMKTLIDFIPKNERLITIEDTSEITFVNHENYVHLYYPSEAKSGEIVTASTLLKTCLRMKPDRILLAELRSGETFDFIQVLSSGHGGSITSCHAGSIESTFERLILMTKQNSEGRGIDYNDIKRLLKQTIDIIVHLTNHNGKRGITEVYYKGIKQFYDKR